MSFAPGYVLQGDGYAYEILKTLGRGGMGEVYLALDNVGRRVALKTIKPQLWLKSDFRDRFHQEARVMGQLVHPYIIRMLSYFTRQDTAFIVMEFVEGPTLSDIIAEQQSWAWQDALPRFREALDALSYAHQKGVIHRDLKPSNFILDTEQGHLKVMDFGLAYIRQTEAEEDEAEARLTKVGLRAGTLKYMPPEQLRDLTATDQRSDIYALGMTFYKVLVGALPFDGLPDQLIFEAISRGSLPPRALDTVMQKLANRSPDLAPDRLAAQLPPPHAFNPAVPPALSAILMKAIAHDPDDRYPTARAMREALDVFEQSHGMDEATMTMMADDEATRTVFAGAAATTLTPHTPTAPAGAGAQGPATTGPSPAVPPPDSRWPRYVGGVLLAAVAIVAALWLLPDLIGPADPVTPPASDTLRVAVNDSLQGGSVDDPSQTPLETPTEAETQPGDDGADDDTVNPADPPPVTPPAPMGTLVLATQPSGSDYSIWLDGDRVESGNLRLPAGAHRIAFVHPRYGERDTTVTVPADGSVSLTCHFEAFVSANMATETNELTFGTWIVNGDTLRDARYRNRGLAGYRLPAGEHRIQAGKYGQFTEPYVFVIEPGFQRQERRLPSFRVPSL